MKSTRYILMTFACSTFFSMGVAWSQTSNPADKLPGNAGKADTAKTQTSSLNAPQTIINTQIAKAQERMRADLKTYSRDDLRQIETLYQVANKKWKTEEGKASLKKLIAQYDKANRTGCALLYLGQMTRGEEQIGYLKQAIEKFSDCYYGNGVQVGANARMILASIYFRRGDRKKAVQLLQEVKTNYPNAITHRGQSMVAIVDQELTRRQSPPQK